VKLAVLVSGRGSNLEAVLRAAAGGGLSHLEPVLVVSNRPAVRALDVAARYAVPSLVLARGDFADAGARDRRIGEAVSDARAECVLLAGYDQLLRPPYFEAFCGLTINVHPSLLPAHGGRGMVGMAVHASVLAAGDRETGVTVHEVTPELDAGPLLAQRRVPVIPGDDASGLAARVLAVEHELLVATLARLSRRTGAGMASATMTAGRVLQAPSMTRSGDPPLDA
jgi:phosphoribosylglycinamide formyltransferase 1